MSLAAALKRLSADRGWSQGDVALKSKLDRTYVNRLFRGKTKDISMRTALRLAHAFGITVEGLWEMCEEEGTNATDGDHRTGRRQFL